MSSFPLKLITATVVIPSGSATANSADLDAKINGEVEHIYVDAPVMTQASYTVALTGPATGMTLFSKAALTPNAKTNIVADVNNQLLRVPVVEGTTLSITAAGGNEAADRTFTIKLLVKQRV